MLEFFATIHFDTDVMYDKFTEEDARAIEEGKTSKGKKQKPDPADEIINRAHINANNEFIVPNEWLYGAMSEALKFQKVGMQGMGRFVGAIDIIGDTFALMRNGKPISVGEHTDDVRACSGGQGAQKVKIIKHRARISSDEANPISCSFVIRFDETKLTAFQIKQAIEDSGQLIGLGSFRPEHKGRFGKFHLAQLKKIRQWAVDDRCEMDPETAALFTSSKKKDAVPGAKKERKTASV